MNRTEMKRLLAKISAAADRVSTSANADTDPYSLTEIDEADLDGIIQNLLIAAGRPENPEIANVWDKLTGGICRVDDLTDSEADQFMAWAYGEAISEGSE